MDNTFWIGDYTSGDSHPFLIRIVAHIRDNQYTMECIHDDAIVPYQYTAGFSLRDDRYVWKQTTQEQWALAMMKGYFRV